MAFQRDSLGHGIITFAEKYLITPVVDDGEWGSQKARNFRYVLRWAMSEQTTYRDFHTWATAYKKKYGMYEYIRALSDCAYQVMEFYKSHLFGGLLDLEAGEQGAIPITTEKEALRPALAHLWKWSRMQTQKDVLSVRGAVLGDAVIEIVDDVQRGRVYLDLMHPGILESVEKDPFGSVKGYIISKRVDDPRGKMRPVTYREEVSREGDLVVYETFLDDGPYAWPENTDRTGQPVSTWRVPYGFVPLVVLQHNDVGLGWGWSELHPVLSKVQEVDGLVSQLSDGIRKFLDPVWIMKGVQKPENKIIAFIKSLASLGRPQPGKELVNMVWGPVESGAQAMVPPLDLAGIRQHIDSLMESIERDVPELSSDIHTASGDASGRALRVARQPVVSKVLQRRMNYDAALVAAQQMAIAIGGFRGYEGYEGFNLDSYAKGDLDHSIADRPVFEEDPLDEIEVHTAFWIGAVAAVKAGLPLEAYLREADWTEERIAAAAIEEATEAMEEGEEDGETDS